MLGAPEGEQLVPEAESLLKTSEQKAAEAEKAISEHLGHGEIPEAHDVRAAKRLNDIIQGTKKNIGSIFDEVKGDLKETNVLLPRGREVKQITHDLQKAIKEGGYGTKEVENLAKELEQAEKGGKDIINGAHFLSMYRSTRGLANKAVRNSRKTDIDALERDHWEKQANELNETADKMNELLKQHMSDENYSKLKEANYRWRTEITPLYKNKLYYDITKEGRLPSDIIKQVRGTGEGQDLLRKIIKSDPEILKNVVGQRYGASPKNLLQFDELAHEFIKEMPELRSLLNTYKQTLKQKASSEKNLIQAKERAQAMQSEAERVKKSFSEVKKQQEIRQKSGSDLEVINQKIANLERYIPELKKKTQAKNLSLEKKIELEAKIAKAEEDIASLKNRAFMAAIGLGGIGLGAMGFRRKTPSMDY
jgi:hypothetical protein